MNRVTGMLSKGLSPKILALALMLGLAAPLLAPHPCLAAEAAKAVADQDGKAAEADSPEVAKDRQTLEKAWEAYNLGHYKKVLSLVEPLAEKGNPHAQILLGRLYENSLGVEENPVAAAEWYGRAAEAGSPEAMLLLAYCCELGFGTVKDGAQAFAWTQKAADLDYPEAQYALAMMLNKGRIVEPNPKLSFAWAEKAARAGYAEAQRYLGACYEHGYGVPANMDEANRWYAEAEKKGLSREGSVFSAPVEEQGR